MDQLQGDDEEEKSLDDGMDIPTEAGMGEMATADDTPEPLSAQGYARTNTNLGDQHIISWWSPTEKRELAAPTIMSDSISDKFFFSLQALQKMLNDIF